MIDVIVPVYDGLDETIRCIQSVLDNKNLQPFNLLVVDDCSPNPDIKSYLQDLSAKGVIELLVNEVNLGFVGTVNRGMSLHPDRDVLLLNSDTVVANDWLDRIMQHADFDPCIATITPFSNNAEICSFPRYCQPNQIFDGMSVDDLDSVFSRLPMRQIDVPTGVGFCMYIRREAINEVGIFDQETFGRGYGEENDFCMRAAAMGWRNVTCSNVFVFHDGGVSFSTEKAARVQHAMEVLNKKYPSYHRLVHEHLQRDPERPFRTLAQLEIIRKSPLRKYLFIAHGLGGGVIKHLSELADHVRSDVICIFLKPVVAGYVEVGCCTGDYSWSLFFDLNNDYKKLLDLLDSIGVERVHLHHVMGVSDDVLSLLDDLDVPFDVTLHDYYFVNANPTLTDRDGVFAELPDTRDTLCSESYPIPHQMTVSEWRAKYGELLSKAARIFSPTVRCKEVHLEYFPDLSIDVAYHPEWESSYPYPKPKINPMSEGEKLKVLVIGAMSREKGADVLERTATYRDPLDRLEYHLLGYAYRPLAPEVVQHGAYDDKNLDNLIAELNPHLIWFPAQWHETYCYTLSAAMRTSLPILASDIGSFPERLFGRPLSFIKSWRSSPIEWNDTLLQIRDALIASQGESIHSENWQESSLKGGDFLYSRDYVLKGDARCVSLKPLPSIEKISSWSYSPAVKNFMGETLRERILFVLQHLRELPGLHYLFRLIPYQWQRQVKRWFSRRPMHEIINARSGS